MATDNFNRASLGSNWTEIPIMDAALQIIGGSAVGGAAGYNNSGMYYNVESFNAAQYGKVKVSTNIYSGLVFRCDPANNNHYDLFIRSFSASYGARSGRYVNGTYTLTGTSYKTCDSGVVLEGRMESAENGNIDLYYDGVDQDFTFTDSSILAGGYAGLYMYALDNTTGVLDDWEAGNISSGPTSISVSDAGAGADSVSVSVALDVSESGTGADNFPGMAVAVPITDQGQGSEVVSPVVSLSVQDTAAAVDAISQIFNALLVPDAGSAVDSLAQALVNLSISDSGGGNDSVSPNISLSLSDAGTALDVVGSIVAYLAVADEGTGTDGLSLITDILKIVMDSGTGSDSVSVPGVSLSIGDSAIGQDLITQLAAALSIQDFAAATDLISTLKTRLVQVADSGTAADAVSMSVSLMVSDVATALDAVGQVLNSLSVPDTGTGFDSVVKTDFDLLPAGKVRITFSMKIPGVTFAIKKPGAVFS
jgi:hypothetical protein